MDSFDCNAHAYQYGLGIGVGMRGRCGQRRPSKHHNTYICHVPKSTRLPLAFIALHVYGEGEPGNEAKLLVGIWPNEQCVQPRRG